MQVAVATSFRMIDGLGHDSLEDLRARATLRLLEATPMAHFDYMVWLLRLEMPNPSEAYSNLLDANLSHYFWHTILLLIPPVHPMTFFYSSSSSSFFFFCTCCLREHTLHSSSGID